MRSLKKQFRIDAGRKDVWQALTDERTIEAWSGFEAQMNERVRTHFTLWGGDIRGQNLESERYEKLVQEWEWRKWPERSRVEIRLYDQRNGDATLVELTHSNIPDDETDEAEEFWREKFFEKLIAFLEK